MLKQRTQTDIWIDETFEDGDGEGKRLLLEGDGDTAQTVTPAHTAAHKHKRRIREIAEELSLWAGFQ